MLWALHLVLDLLRKTSSFVLMFLAFLSFLLFQEERDVFGFIQKVSQSERWRKGCIDMEHTISRVVLKTASMSVFHGLFGWLSCMLSQSSLAFTTGMLSFLAAMFPFVGTYWMALPAVLELILKYRYWNAAVLGSSHVVVYWFVDPIFYSEIKGAPPFVAAFSAVGGMMAFGMHGMFVGPIIVAIVWNQFRSGNDQTTKKKEEEKGKEKEEEKKEEKENDKEEDEEEKKEGNEEKRVICSEWTNRENKGIL